MVGVIWFPLQVMYPNSLSHPSDILSLGSVALPPLFDCLLVTVILGILNKIARNRKVKGVFFEEL